MTGPIQTAHERPGYDRLWNWFGLSYASWITIPRILAHEMPDDWQNRMAQLLEEYSEATSNPPHDVEDLIPTVGAKRGRRYTKWPDWILRYRHPNATGMLGWMRENLERIANSGPGEEDGPWAPGWETRSTEAGGAIAKATSDA